MKRISPVVIVGLLLTFCCSALYVFEPGFIGAISLKAYDVFMQAVQEPPKSGRVVFVDIDEDSLAKQGQWPWPRHLVAQLSRRILDGKASVLAFDVMFPEPDGQSPSVMQRNFHSKFNLDVKIDGIPDSLADFDGLFAATLAGARDRTILGCFMFPAAANRLNEDVPEVDPNYRGYFYVKGAGPAENINDALIHADRMTISIPELSESAGNNAFFNSWPDADNVVRRIPLVMAYGSKRIYPALAVEAVRMDMGIKQIGIECGSIGGVLNVDRLRMKDIVIPTDFSGQMIVNFRSPMPRMSGKGFRSFPAYPAWEVLSEGFDASCFSNKIVFVGTSAAALMDNRATPLTGSQTREQRLAGEKTSEFAGVEVHATIVDNILSGDILFQPWWIRLVDITSIVLMGLFLTFLIARGRAVLSFVATVVVLALAFCVSYLLFSRVHFVFVPVRLLTSTFMIYPVLTMIRYWQEERQKKRVRNMFGTMVSSAVLKYLEKNPESFSLTGCKADATIFFSDIAGFTTISEAMKPDRLSDLLNRYLSPMTKIIMDREGLVDKYEGDLIMAEWGVPFAKEDHAVQACYAALEQQARLAELRPVLKKEFGHDIFVRMGINSGVVTAGNMGSDRRFQFTVIGDAVNLARRLEPANKDYGVCITIGEDTFEKARSSIEARMLDRIIVKGKSKPVLIYELLGRIREVPAERIRLARLYEEALGLYWDVKWDDAIARLEEILRADPSDGPSVTMLNRAKKFRANPPVPGWSGVYLREDK